MGRKKKPGEPKIEMITVRIAPQAKFALDLLARYQRRTLSSVIDWAIDQTLRRESIPSPAGEHAVHDMVRKVWDPFEPDRLVKLALWDSSLLTFEEQTMWKLIQEEPSFWTLQKPPTETRAVLKEVMEGQKPFPDFKRIRAQWENIKAAAYGATVDFREG